MSNVVIVKPNEMQCLGLNHPLGDVASSLLAPYFEKVIWLSEYFFGTAQSSSEIKM